MLKNFLLSCLLTFLSFTLVIFVRSSNRIVNSAAFVTPETESLAQQIVTPDISLDQIFDLDHSKVKSLPQGQTITLLATGDVMLGRSVNAYTVQAQNFNYPFEQTSEILKSADITLINLEGPFHNPCPIKTDGMYFCGDIRNVQGLADAGIDVANLANNHTSNYGDEGLQQTEELLKDKNILMSGIDGPIYKEVKGTKIAFLGFNDIDPRYAGPTTADDDVIKRQVEEAKQNSDFVIVSFHWGVEYQPQPSTKQKYLAHFAIDNGADLIIGNHPHWYQPVEIYKDKVIVYSHGNFVFDQDWSEKTQEGMVGKYTIYDNKLVDVEFLPVLIAKHGQPYWAEGEIKQKLLSDFKNQSQILQKNLNNP